MKMKKTFMKLLISTMLVSSLFATSAFAAGGTHSVREEEPNNTMATAETMYFQTPGYNDKCIYGTVNNSNDTDDWFKIKYTLDDSRYKKINSNIYFWGTPDCSYEVTVLDSFGNWRGYKVVPGGGDMRLINITVNDQDYIYIHIKHNQGTAVMPYTIQICQDGLIK